MAPRSEKYLLLYSTTDGHTKTIMEAIAKQVTAETNTQCDVVDLRDSDHYDLSAYAKVLIGASIRYGHFNSLLISYAEKNAVKLNTMPSAFFGVNLTARKAEKSTAMTNVYTRKFLERSPWVPQLSGVFAGALWYPRYNLFDRLLIQFIMRVTGGETDSTKEVVYTDWTAVQKFASDFAKLPASSPPRSKPAKAASTFTLAGYGNSVRVALAAVGISAAVVLGRKFILAKRT